MGGICYDKWEASVMISGRHLLRQIGGICYDTLMRGFYLYILSSGPLQKASNGLEMVYGYGCGCVYRCITDA